MSNEDFLLTVGLDPSAVDRALAQIENRVDQMVASSNKRMQVMGQATLDVTNKARTLLAQYQALGDSAMTVDERKSFDKLQKDILKTANSLETLLKNMRNLEFVGEGPAMRFEVRDELEKDIGKLRGDILGRKLTEIMGQAEGVVADHAKKIRADLLLLLQDPTLSGKELNAQLDILEGNLKDVAKATYDAQSVAGQPRALERDARLKDLGQAEGQALSDRLYRAIQQTEGAVDSMQKEINQKATRIREDLVRAMEDPLLSGERLRKEVARLGAEYDDTVQKARAMQQATTTSFGGRQDTQAREVSRIIGEAEVGDLYRQIERVMDTTDDVVREGAERIKAQLDGLLTLPPEGDQFRSEIKRLNADMRDLQKIKPLDIVDAEELSQMRAVVTSFDNIQKVAEESSQTVTAYGQVVIAEQVAIGQAFNDAYQRGTISAEAAAAGIDRATRAIRLQATVYKEVDVAASELDNRLASIFTDVETQALSDQVVAMMSSASTAVSDGAVIIQEKLSAAFSTIKDPQELLGVVRQLQGEANKLSSIKPLEVVATESVARAGSLATALKEIEQVSQEVAQGVTAEGRILINAHIAAAKAAADNAEATDRGQQTAISAIRQHATEIRRVGRVYREVKDEIDSVAEAAQEAIAEMGKFSFVDDVVSGKKAMNDYNSSMATLEKLSKSSNQEVRQLAAELTRIGKEAKYSFDEGTSEAKEFEKTVDHLKSTTKNVADAYGENIPAGANKASISLWKLGNVADRIGLRGAGGATQLVDALRSLPPVAIAGVVAVAAVGAAVIKLTQALVEMGKRAAQAFFEFTKGAVDTAKSIEVTDNQLGGFLRAPSLGEDYRKLLQNKGFEVGLDLTKDFSRVIVPLGKDLKEVEKAAEIAGTLAHAFQETDEAIANAIKQAAGGHFRPLIERFGLTEFEISRIEEYQKKYGEFTGVLMGLQDALDFRGLNINTISGTLQFLQGQLSVLRKQIETTMGEPVRDELSEQFKRLFDIVEQRKDALLGFFRSLGETIASVVERVGGIAEGLIGDVTDEDIVEFQEAIDILGQKIGDAVEAAKDLFTSDDKNIVEVATELTDVMTKLTGQLEQILQFFNGILEVRRAIADVGDIGGFDQVKPYLPVVGQAGLAKQGFGLVKDITRAIGGADVDFGERFLNIGKAAPLLTNVIGLMEDLGVISEEDAEALDGLTKAQDENTESTKRNADEIAKLINERQKLVAQMQDLEELMIAAQAAQKKIDDEEAKLARERYIREGEIRTRYDREDMDALEKRSQDREDLFARHMQRMLQLTDDYNFQKAQAELDFDNKALDATTTYNDKIEDIEREAGEKKIDVERKYRERINDIRKKFDLDAEEAIRRNDAVALLRIRRRMQLELEQAEEQRQRDVDAAEDAEQKKRDEAKLWLDRQNRDLEISEQRKLAELEASDQHRRDQLIEQYNWEYAQIYKEYDRQKAARETAEQRAIDDMNAQFDEREKQMFDSLEAEYNIVKEWKDKETHYMRLKLKEQNNIIQQQYKMWTQEGSLFSQFLSKNMPTPGTGSYNPLNPTGPTTGIGGRADSTDPYGSDEQGRIGGRLHGGYVTSGNAYGINERGPETFYATRAGIIASRDALHMPTRYTGPTTTQIDNSRTLTGDIYAMDPSRMSPIDRTLMASMFTEQLLAHGL